VTSGLAGHAGGVADTAAPLLRIKKLNLQQQLPAANRMSVPTSNEQGKGGGDPPPVAVQPYVRQE